MKTKLAGIIVMIAVSLPQITEASPKFRSRPNAVPGEFIVVLKERVPPEALHGIANSIASAHDGLVVSHWFDVFSGFLLKGSEQSAISIARDPRVAFVEDNFVVSMTIPPVSGTVWTWPPSPNDTEYMWHLDRIDEVSWSQRDSQYNMCTDGDTVVAYVIDTGVQAAHPEFGNRVLATLDFSSDRIQEDPFQLYSVDTTQGCYASPAGWHATAVAGTLAGSIVGASRAQIVSLKWINCGLEGHYSYLLNALDWIQSGNNPYRDQPGVVNLSGFQAPWDSGTGFSALGLAVDNLVNNTAFPFFTSADNFSGDACEFSPNYRAYTASSKTGRAFVVGGSWVSDNPSDNTDYKYQLYLTNGNPRLGQDSGSNAGPCVSIFAPGGEIFTSKSANPQFGDYHRPSGTSFASPIVAGVAARYIEKTVPRPSATEVYEFLLTGAIATISNDQAFEQWICLPSTGPQFFNSDPSPGSNYCPSGDPKLHWAGHTSTNAKLLYWDEGVCW